MGQMADAATQAAEAARAAAAKAADVAASIDLSELSDAATQAAEAARAAAAKAADAAASLDIDLNAHAGALRTALAGATPQLRAAADAFAAVPFYWALLGHCIAMNLLFKGKYRDNWLKSFWVAFIGAFGGGTMMNLLSYQPVSWLADNNMVYMFFAVWYAINYLPSFGLVPALANFVPVRIASKAASTLLRAQLLITMVDAGVKAHPGQWYTPLFYGTVAATGGKFIADAVAAISGESTLSSFYMPEWAVRSGFIGSVVYVLLAYSPLGDYEPLLEAELAAAAVTTLFLAHTVASDLLDDPLDWTAPFEWIFHLVTRVPPSKSDAIFDEAVAEATPSAGPAPSATPSRIEAPSTSTTPAPPKRRTLPKRK